MADHLEDEEIVERVRTWWRENGVSLVATILLVVGGWLGWNWYDSSREQYAEASFNHFSRYVELRQAGEAETDEAVEVLAVLDQEYEGSAGHLLSLLYRCADAVAGEELQQAASYLEQVIAHSSDAQMQELARMRLARVYLEQERVEDAQMLLNSPGGVGFLSMRSELQGDIFARLGDQAAARAAYQAALEAEADAGGTGLWPFLSMKLSGISPDGDSEPFSDTGETAPEEPDDVESLNESFESVEPDDPMDDAGDSVDSVDSVDGVQEADQSGDESAGEEEEA